MIKTVIVEDDLMVASETGLSRVTIRRYMNFLIEENEVISQIDYSTGGRPSILYQINL